MWKGQQSVDGGQKTSKEEEELTFHLVYVTLFFFYFFPHFARCRDSAAAAVMSRKFILQL
jgi:hypothetical protein